MLPSFKFIFGSTFQNFSFSLSMLCKIFLETFFVCFFRAAPAAYGGSQAKGQIRAVAAGLHHSHSNADSKPCLQPTPQLKATPDA